MTYGQLFAAYWAACVVLPATVVVAGAVVVAAAPVLATAIPIMLTAAAAARIMGIEQGSDADLMETTR